MKIIYEDDVVGRRIAEAIGDAQATNRRIKKIILTKQEFDDLKCELRAGGRETLSSGAGTSVYDVNIVVEEADEGANAP